MAGYVWASIGFGLLAVLCFCWALGMMPWRAYPQMNWPDKVADAIMFAVFVLGMVSTGWSAVMADRADHHMPACLAEDGGPALPCRWDGGVTENGLRQWIIYDRAE